MLEAVHREVSPDIPRPSMLSLLTVFRDHRPLLHGRALAQGNQRGVEGITTYDAACLALALLDEEHRGLAGWTFNEKGRDALLKHFQIGAPVTTESDLDKLAALQKQIGMAPGQTVARPQRRPQPDDGPTE